MKTKDIRVMKDDELLVTERNLMEDVFRIRFQIETGQLSNTSKLQETKKSLARVKTIIKERGLTGQSNV